MMNATMDAGAAAQIFSNMSPSKIPGGKAVSKMTDSQIKQVSSDFESMFIGMMIEHMFGESVGAESFGDRESADVYKGLMTDILGKEIAAAGGIGIAPYVQAELLKLQEQEK
jgi:flagellar protein FlgJ